MTTTNAEQETVIRWDLEERVAHLWTASAVQARRWTRLGYPVEVHGRTRTGEPHTWSAQVPTDALRWRKVRAGRVVRRKSPSKVVGPRQFTGVEPTTGAGMATSPTEAGDSDSPAI
jgi:hypothetical protein